MHHSVCTCLRAAAAGRMIHYYDYKYLPISLASLHKLLNLNVSKESKMHSLGLFSSSVCREHWVWLYKLQFLFFLWNTFFFISAAWSWTNYIFESTSKGEEKKKRKTNGTQVDHTWNTWISTGRCVVAATTSAPTDRPPQQWPSHHLGETISSWIFSLHMLET